MAMKYEVELPGTDDLTEAIVEDIANRYMHGGEYSDGLRKKIEAAAVLRVEALIHAEVDSIVAGHLSRTVQPTNEMGEAVGPPVTMSGRISKIVSNCLEQKV